MPTSLQSKPRNQNLTAAEFTQIQAYLARQGLGQEQIESAIGASAGGLDRGGIAASLRAWLIKR
ncbi:MAG: hypothetical protein JXA42_08300 [Anaerolineales bacterium]|nr:hypothetical protein [Anaerolineales bacterium]